MWYRTHIQFQVVLYMEHTEYCTSCKLCSAKVTTILSKFSDDECHLCKFVILQPSQRTFRIKIKLAKKMKQNRPIPHWIRMRTDNTIRWSSHPYLQLWFCLMHSAQTFQHLWQQPSTSAGDLRHLWVNLLSAADVSGWTCPLNALHAVLKTWRRFWWYCKMLSYLAGTMPSVGIGGEPSLGCRVMNGKEEGCRLVLSLQQYLTVVGFWNLQGSNHQWHLMNTLVNSFLDANFVLFQTHLCFETVLENKWVP